MGSSANPGVNHLHPIIPEKLRPPTPHPSLLESNYSSPPLPPPHLPNSCRRRSLAAAKISFNVAFVCFSSAACHHHGYHIFTPSCRQSLLWAYQRYAVRPPTLLLSSASILCFSFPVIFFRVVFFGFYSIN